MGRITGFLAGALFTSALTYYTGEYIRKDQQFVSRQLRLSQALIAEGIIGGKDVQPTTVKLPPRRQFAETAKDIWNDEIIRTVNWIYSINWYDLGVKTDEKLVHLTNKVAHGVADKK